MEIQKTLPKMLYFKVIQKEWSLNNLNGKNLKKLGSINKTIF